MARLIEKLHIRNGRMMFRYAVTIENTAAVL